MDFFFTVPLLVLIGLACGALFMVAQHYRADDSGMSMQQAMSAMTGTGPSRSKAAPKQDKPQQAEAPESKS